MMECLEMSNRNPLVELSRLIRDYLSSLRANMLALSPAPTDKSVQLDWFRSKWTVGGGLGPSFLLTEEILQLQEAMTALSVCAVSSINSLKVYKQAIDCRIRKRRYAERDAEIARLRDQERHTWPEIRSVLLKHPEWSKNRNGDPIDIPTLRQGYYQHSRKERKELGSQEEA
jgi:hypothetical protein